MRAVFGTLRWLASFAVVGGALLTTVEAVQAQLIPGTGNKVEQVGDDFEDPEWSFVYNLPKASDEQDGQTRMPGGFSKNRRWNESALRGVPDHLRRVETPAGGLPGSTGALLIMSRDTGIPGRPSNQMQQDDLLMNVQSRMGGNIPVSRMPNFVVRVFVPPFDDFERRTGITFGVRAGLFAPRTKTEQSGGLAAIFGGSRTTTSTEPYWPGFFVHFDPKAHEQGKEGACYFLLRANERGHDFRGPAITQSGWWTLGMSFTPDGMVHWYAKPGVENLTAADHLASRYCYGMKAQQFETVFFNICSPDNNRTWSTPWIVDDVELFLAR